MRTSFVLFPIFGLVEDIAPNGPQSRAERVE